ncbi:MAG: Gfo/Idh/MocA family oxidoreductase [Cyclobacteriaceae bacterium]|nr:Gfo/Idh/MocA family oxidoreductase [Cyclobacteriaceae bacterium]
MKNFALIGAAGFIAPRHLKAIKDTRNNLVAALDKFDSVGVMDGYFPQADFFTEFERFDRHLDKLRRQGQRVDYVSICSPNYLHDSHIRFALRHQADAICEKPLVLNPWNVDALAEIERETGKRVYTILQLRLHPSIIQLREEVAQSGNKKHQIKLEYITSRGKWYYRSWKGEEQKSGGIATNIGVHFFDMLTWVFGAVQDISVKAYEADHAAGHLELDRASVDWFLSINEDHLPATAKSQGKRTYRSLTMEGREIEFSDGFTDLHTKSYEAILAGQGFGLAEARPSVELVHRLREHKAG